MSQPTSCIAVLGGPKGNEGALSLDTLNRVETGFLQWQETGEPIVLAGADAVRMKDEVQLLASHDGKQPPLILEPRSREVMSAALLFKRDVLQPLGMQSITLVTADYEMAYAREMFGTVLGPLVGVRTLRANDYDYTEAEISRLRLAQYRHRAVARLLFKGFCPDDPDSEAHTLQKVQRFASNRYPL